MTAEVIELRLKPKPKIEEPQFYCVKCDFGSFKLLSNGAVHCKGCGALMSNLEVVQK